MITLNDYLTSSGKFPERAKSKELTPELLKNAQSYVDAMNDICTELGVTPPPFSSGFRPLTVNAATVNAAKASYHLKCLAGDFEDDANQTFGKLLASRPDLLRKYGLFLEDLKSTKGKFTNWAHTDKGKRADRPSRIFKP